MNNENQNQVVDIAVLTTKLQNLADRVEIGYDALGGKLDKVLDTLAKKADTAVVMENSARIRKLEDWMLKESTIYRLINWGLPAAAIVYSFFRK